MRTARHTKPLNMNVDGELQDRFPARTVSCATERNGEFGEKYYCYAFSQTQGMIDIEADSLFFDTGQFSTGLEAEGGDTDIEAKGTYECKVYESDLKGTTLSCHKRNGS